MLIEKLICPMGKGKRTRSARMLSGLNRLDFQNKYGIHVNTLKSWENPKGTKGLTYKGAQRFIAALKQEGILCTDHWLLTGVGAGPRIINSEMSIMHKEADKQDAILKEVQFFLDVNHNATVTVLTNNFMAPYYRQGDYVGGYKRPTDDLAECVNLDCIVETDLGEILVCRFVPTEHKAKFRIIYISENNVASSVKVAALKYAAPIIWHRRAGK